MMKPRSTPVMLAALCLLAGSAAHAQPMPPPKPGGEQPRGDITRKAPAGVIGRSGPGTQTEDDIYIGRRVPGTVAPTARPVAPGLPGTAGPVDRGFKDGSRARPLTPPGPLAAPAGIQPVRPLAPTTTPGTTNVKPLAGTRSRATGDDDEMEDLDIQRRKAQGLPDNKPLAPQPKEQPGGEQPRGERRQ